MKKTDNNKLPGIKELHEDLKHSLVKETFVSLLLLDIDSFSSLNLSHGREIGDKILNLIEDYIINQNWRGYRIGGDEFAVLFTVPNHADSRPENALFLSDLCQLTLGVNVTISGGGVHINRKDMIYYLEMHRVIYSASQQLLIISKKLGKNKIIWLPEDSVISFDLMVVLNNYYRNLAFICSSAAKKLKIESRMDFLTGLYNRRGFEDSFSRTVDLSRRRNEPLAVLYIDSDSLKDINDKKGHDAGDRFIVDLSRILKSLVRGSDIVTRWGADEFAIILENASESQAMLLAERIREGIEKRTEGTVSIGVYCGIPQSQDQALRQADEAMYQAKKHGKNCIELVSA